MSREGSVVAKKPAPFLRLPTGSIKKGVLSHFAL
jgi:hypothetical protein